MRFQKLSLKISAEKLSRGKNSRGNVDKSDDGDEGQIQEDQVQTSKKHFFRQKWICNQFRKSLRIYLLLFSPVKPKLILCKFSIQDSGILDYF